MDFAIPADKIIALTSTVRLFPELIRAFEDGVTRLGLRIADGHHVVAADGMPSAVLIVRNSRLRLELDLRGEFNEVLFLKPDERPSRVDPGVVDGEYGRRRVSDVVRARLEMVREVVEGGDLDQAWRRVAGTAGRGEWKRIEGLLTGETE